MRLVGVKGVLHDVVVYLAETLADPHVCHTKSKKVTV